MLYQEKPIELPTTLDEALLNSEITSEDIININAANAPGYFNRLVDSAEGDPRKIMNIVELLVAADHNRAEVALLKGALIKQLELKCE